MHRGGGEPDAEHLNKSYDDFYQDGNIYMVPKEGMIAAFRYRFETGKMYDVDGLTRFHALGSGGGAMSMCCHNDGRFSMDGAAVVIAFSATGLVSLFSNSLFFYL